MIDEEKQDEIISHLLDPLEPVAVGELSAQLAADFELASFADELRETTAALAHAAPLRLPPPALRAKVLAAIHAESSAKVLPLPSGPRKSIHLPDWLPWAVAAGIALGSVLQLRHGENLWESAARSSAEAQASRAEADQLRERNSRLESETKLLAGQATQLQQELDSWKKRDALSEVRIATLKAQVSALSNAGAVIVWDAEQQRGIAKLSNVPKASAGKDYQLWVIDPKYPSPVSAGVVTVGADGSGYVSFSPQKPVTKPDKFAISVERTGGAPAPAGPIVFIGD